VCGVCVCVCVCVFCICVRKETHKYKFSFQVHLVGLPFTCIHDYTEAQLNEELRVLGTKRKQLNTVHIMINFIIGIRSTPLR